MNARKLTVALALASVALIFLPACGSGGGNPATGGPVETGGLVNGGGVIPPDSGGSNGGGGNTDTTAPIARAGNDQTVTDTDNSGSEPVTLDGNGSTDNVSVTGYTWHEGATELGTTAQITAVLTVGVHDITLTVKDAANNSASDTVKVTVNAGSSGDGNTDTTAPVARAGADQTVTDTDNSGSELVTLNGNGSTDNVGITAYEWTQGQTVLGSGTQLTVTMAIGTHTVRLTVRDAAGNSATDTVTITVQSGSGSGDNTDTTAPVARAGNDQAVTDTDNSGSESVTLNGSGSTDNVAVVNYVWTEGSANLGTTAQITSSFAVGVHDVTLTVKDTANNSASDTVKVTVNAGSSGDGNTDTIAPVANADNDVTVIDTDNNGSEGISLDGRASTDNVGIVSYAWTEGNTNLGSTAQLTATFAVGVHTVKLTVFDAAGNGGDDTVIVTIQPPANPSVGQIAGGWDYAEVSEPMNFSIGITTNRSRSRQAVRQGSRQATITFQWSATSGTFSDANAQSTTWTPGQSGANTVTCTITMYDGSTVTRTKNVQIYSTAPAYQGNVPTNLAGAVITSDTALIRGWCPDGYITRFGSGAGPFTVKIGNSASAEDTDIRAGFQKLTSGVQQLSFSFASGGNASSPTDGEILVVKSPSDPNAFIDIQVADSPGDPHRVDAGLITLYVKWNAASPRLRRQLIANAVASLFIPRYAEYSDTQPPFASAITRTGLRRLYSYEAGDRVP